MECFQEIQEDHINAMLSIVQKVATMEMEKDDISNEMF